MANDLLVYDGVVMGIDLGMFGYIGPIAVFPLFCPELIEGLGSNPKGDKLAIIALVYNEF